MFIQLTLSGGTSVYLNVTDISHFHDRDDGGTAVVLRSALSEADLLVVMEEAYKVLARIRAEENSAGRRGQSQRTE